MCEEDLERAGDAVSLRVLRRRPSRAAADSSLDGAVPSSGSEDDDDEYAYGGYSEWDGEGESDDSGMDEELDEDDQDIILLDALAHGNGPHRHPSLAASPSISELDLQRSPMSSVSPASPASPPLNILQTPLPPPHPDIVTIASSDSFSHSNPHDHTQPPSGSPSSPSTLSDLGLVGLNMDNSGMSITLPDDMELLPGGIGKKDSASYEGVHMHPVAHRPSLLATPDTATKTSSTPSSTSASASASQSSSDLSVPGDVEASESRASPAQTHLELQPQLSTQLDAAEQSQLQRQFEAQVQLGQIEGPPARPRAPRRPDTNPAAPPLLTSTFRPKELLRRRRPPMQGGGASSSLPASIAGKLNGSSPARPGQAGGKEDEGWEFVPARVPDGISLRNFGIQVVSFLFRVRLALGHFCRRPASICHSLGWAPLPIMPSSSFAQSSTIYMLLGCPCAQMRLVFDSLGSVLLSPSQNRQNDQQLLAFLLVLMPHAWCDIKRSCHIYPPSAHSILTCTSLRSNPLKIAHIFTPQLPAVPMLRTEI